eukprot:Awhi_evm1s10620
MIILLIDWLSLNHSFNLATEWKKNLFESIKEISIDKQAQVSEDEGGAEVFGEFDSSVDLSHLS